MSLVACMIAKWLGGILAVWLVMALIPSGLLGGEATHPTQETSAMPADVVLTVQEGLLLLWAQNTSLKAIFEAIGQQLANEDVARIPAEERIALAFEHLSLAEALKHFRPYVHYVGVEDATKAQGTIRKLIVVSKRGAGVESRPTMQDGEVLASPSPSPSDAPTPTDTARPKPFTFEFDPAAVGERER